ncbi:MAG: hypothetical protein AW07_00852 [Candidatus Accumulibacter sp. SK-11]|nr:MAG: hypothetical protein AW07_00852 [Candidatus Accumulibacter sp. SK-11]
MSACDSSEPLPASFSTWLSCSACSTVSCAFAGLPSRLAHSVSITSAASSPCLLPRQSRRSWAVILCAPSVWPRSSRTRERFV